MKNFAEEYLANHKLYRLLKRSSEGDERAIETLYKDYSKYIYWHIMDYTDDKNFGEDIFQEVFIKICSLAPGNLPRKGATSWLLRVIHNTAITYLTKPTIKEEPLMENALELKYLRIPSPEDQIIAKEYVRSSINHFDQDTRNILLLRYEGYCFIEISEKLGIKQSTIRSKYSRAMKRLARLTGDERE